MNTVMGSQHFAPTESSISHREKMDHLISNLSRHSSPETQRSQCNSTPVTTSPLHSSPGALRTSSLPETPGSDTEIDPELLNDKRPSSVGLVPVVEQIRRNELTDNSKNKVDYNTAFQLAASEHLKPPSLSPAAVDERSQSEQNGPNWLEVIQHLANICQEKLESSTSSQLPTEKNKEDPESVARSVLSSLNQLIHSNVQVDKRTAPSRSPQCEYPKESLNSAEESEIKKARNVNLDIPTVENFAHADNSQPSLFPPNLMFNPETISSAASVLAMMMGQKQSSQPIMPNPFLAPNLLSCPPISQSNPMRDIQSIFNTKLPQHEDDTSQYKPQFSTFADNRGFLYHLGQQLMAMASSPTPESFPRPAPWNPTPHNQSEIHSSNTLFAPNNTSSLMTNPMLAFMNAGLLQSQSMMGSSAMLPTVPVSPLDKQASILPQSSTSGLDKGISSFPPPPTAALGGISMRGNQKYSAYYQHQRKQGLNYNLSNDPGSTRRSGASTSAPFSCARFGNRRFKGGISSLPTSNMSSELRGQTKSRAAASCTSAASLFSNYRGSAYKHAISNLNSNATRSKNQLPNDIMLNANTTTIPDVSPTPNRLRDTAFLCSCGRDFDSLYGFTLHMKDTGHKPKSDQSERDIPKLVRGQDMWINSETEQTREILRCMRCHQSFRNLPELTLHMMKTNHYSEIVYNDSGRLVFVNPEEQSRRNAQNGLTSTGGSPSKMSHQLNKRNMKSSPSTFDRSGVERDVRKYEKQSQPSETLAETCIGRNSSSPACSSKTERLSPEHVSAIGSGRASHSSSPSTGNPATPMRHETPRCSSSGSVADTGDRSNPDAHANKLESPFGSSVIRQIESFVESSLPQQAKSLSIHVEQSPSTRSRQSSPQSNIDSGSLHPAECKLSPGENRKRTYSGASLSQSVSLECSPLNVSAEPIAEHSPNQQAKRANLSPKSPTTVSSTSQPGQQQLENPLSSLQKLVETTHKPSFSMATTTTPSSSGMLASPSNQAYTMHSTVAASKLTQPTRSPRSKTPTCSSGSHSSLTPSSPTFTHLLSPSGDPDEHGSALSALYAYVEKSSGSSSESRGSKEESNGTASSHRSTEGAVIQEMHSVERNLLNPSFQAFYATALSRLVTQNIQSSASKNTDGSVFPMEACARLPTTSGDTPNATSEFNLGNNLDLTTGWMRVLQALAAPMSVPDLNERRSGESAHSDFMFPTPGRATDQFSELYQDLMRKAFEAKAGTSDDSLSARVNSNSEMGSGSMGYLNLPSKLAGTSQSSVPSSSVDTLTCNGLSSTAHNRSTQILPMRSNTVVSNPASIMSNIITKKAKCHFCGKPFANKGQVRLHISKNKCPCLLQRSCHVAALAAAFGSDAHSNNSLDKTNSVPSVSNARLHESGKLFSQFSSPPMDTSSEKASALSLLKERFQNFDSAASSRHPVENSGSIQNAKSLGCHNCPRSWSPADARNPHFMNDLSSKYDTTQTEVADSSSMVAATNAGHLAAMALLAQTLVQLGSGQLSKMPPTAITAGTTQQMTFPVDKKTTTSGPSDVPPVSAGGGTNWDWLLSQAQLAKHLSSFGWPNSTTEPTDKGDSSSPTLSTGHGANTPNSLI